MTSDKDSSQPDWWQQNELLKQSYELSSYDAPRFQDDPYVHEVVSSIEDELDIQVRFINSEPVENGLWQISINGNSIEEFGRYRDEDANSVFKIHSEEFRESIHQSVQN
jgi:hypothetical protein